MVKKLWSSSWKMVKHHGVGHLSYPKMKKYGKQMVFSSKLACVCLLEPTNVLGTSDGSKLRHIKYFFVLTSSSFQSWMLRKKNGLSILPSCVKIEPLSSSIKDYHRLPPLFLQEIKGLKPTRMRSAANKIRIWSTTLQLRPNKRGIVSCDKQANGGLDWFNQRIMYIGLYRYL